MKLSRHNNSEKRRAVIILSLFFAVLLGSEENVFLSKTMLKRNDKTLAKWSNLILEARTEEEQAHNVSVFCLDFKTRVINRGGRGLQMWFFEKNGQFIPISGNHNTPKEVFTIVLLDLNYPSTFSSILFHPLGPSTIDVLISYKSIVGAIPPRSCQQPPEEHIAKSGTVSWGKYLVILSRSMSSMIL